MKKHIFPIRLLSSTYRSYSTKEIRNQWKSVVGLEIHAQISSQSKLFSRSANEFASPVNTNVSLFDSSIPGTLPVINKRCIEAAVLTALALNCRINPVSMFDRKHYFYADIPAGYQITQQRSPLANDGLLKFQVFTPGKHKTPYVAQSKIKQIQLEQDSGKSLHENDRSLVDLNRAGMPLMELVFEPDLHDAEEAAALVKELCSILQCIGTCSCKMEEGALRVDANVSIHKDNEPFGTRTEIKNIGSVRGVAGAIQYEIKRQIDVLNSGGRIVNETRTWDANTKSTLPMRDKEQQQDYRYMPEPNLPPLYIAIDPVNQGVVNVNKLQKDIPELPEETRTRLMKDYNLSLEQVIVLVNESKLSELFHIITQKGQLNAKTVANFLINELLTLLNKEKLDLNSTNLDGYMIREIIELLETLNINHTTAKVLLAEVISGNCESPKKIVEHKKLQQINDVDKIKEICNVILKENVAMVNQYKSGKTKVFKALLGAVSNKANQRINMEIVNDVLKKLLDK